MNDEFGVDLEAKSYGSIKILSRNVSGGTEENLNQDSRCAYRDSGGALTESLERYRQTIQLSSG
jgi:hypothetical protein